MNYYRASQWRFEPHKVQIEEPVTIKIEDPLSSTSLIDKGDPTLINTEEEEKWTLEDQKSTKSTLVS